MAHNEPTLPTLPPPSRRSPYDKVTPPSPAYSDSAASDARSELSAQRTSSSDDSVEENSYDAPLDFSMKKKRKENHHHHHHHHHERAGAPAALPGDGWQAAVAAAAAAAAATGGTLDSLVAKSWDMIGEPPLAMPALLPGGALAGYGSLGMMSRFPGGLLPHAMLGLTPRAPPPPVSPPAKAVTNGVKALRPFKSYQKEAGLPAGYYGVPGMYQMAGVDVTASAQSMGVRSEEMLKSYRNYMYKLQQEAESQRAAAVAVAAADSDERGDDISEAVLGRGGYSSVLLAGEMSPTTTTGGSARKRAITLPDEQKDEAYWERRRKNNEAAKRSRDARRAKEDEIAIRAAFLEQENLKLRVEVAALKNETAKLRCMLYNS